MIGLYFVKNFNMFTQYKILPAPWLVRIPQSEFTSSKNPSVPVKKRLNCLFFSNAAPKCLFFMGVDDFHQCICLSQAQQIQNPTFWVNPMIFCRPNIPNKYRSATHTHTHTQKKCIFALAKPIFTAGVFGDPIPFSRQVLRTLHGSTRAGSTTKKASFYNGFAEQPLYNQIV